MKRVTLTDIPAGNALGWNPNGGSRFFSISESAITVPDTHFVGVSLGSGQPGQVCMVSAYNTFANIFDLDCTVAPNEGTDLEYVVVTLPPHIVS